MPPSSKQTAAWIVLGVLLVACADPCATAENEAVLSAAAAEKGAIRTDSGLVFLELKKGSGPTPDADNRVQVHYEGRFADGRVFDGSIERGRPSSFPLSRVIAGWTEGLQMLQGGGMAKLTIPPRLAYGDDDTPTIPPCSVLIFEIELLGIYD